HYRRGQVAQGKACAVSTGGECPGNRLAVDVALVDHRQAGRPQGLAEGIDGGAGCGGDALSGVVDMAYAAHVGQRQVQAIGQRYRGERMPGPGHPNVHAVAAGLVDQRAQLVFA
ncbi:hypothetical protein QWI17_05670, partial [Gilvimarinus sp. SDUM040013]